MFSGARGELGTRLGPLWKTRPSLHGADPMGLSLGHWESKLAAGGSAYMSPWGWSTRGLHLPGLTRTF